MAALSWIRAYWKSEPAGALARGGARTWGVVVRLQGEGGEGGREPSPPPSSLEGRAGGKYSHRSNPRLGPRGATRPRKAQPGRSYFTSVMESPKRTMRGRSRSSRLEQAPASAAAAAMAPSLARRRLRRKRQLGRGLACHPGPRLKRRGASFWPGPFQPGQRGLQRCSEPQRPRGGRPRQAPAMRPNFGSSLRNALRVCAPDRRGTPALLPA